MKKKLLSVALALIMVVTILPFGLTPEKASAEVTTSELYLEAENYLTYKVYASGTTDNPTTKTFLPTDSVIKSNDAYHGGKRFENDFNGAESAEVEILFTVSKSGMYKVTLDSISTSGSKLYLDGEELIDICPESEQGNSEEWAKSMRNGVELVKDRRYTFKLSFSFVYC